MQKVQIFHRIFPPCQSPYNYKLLSGKFVKKKKTLHFRWLPVEKNMTSTREINSLASVGKNLLPLLPDDEPGRTISGKIYMTADQQRCD